jgi:hypothetical protein
VEVCDGYKEEGSTEEEGSSKEEGSTEEEGSSKEEDYRQARIVIRLSGALSQSPDNWIKKARTSQYGPFFCG